MHLRPALTLATLLPFRSRSKSRKPEDRSKKRGDERTKKKTREYRSNPRKRVSDRRHGGGDRHRDGEMRTARKKSTLVEEGGYVKMRNF